MIINLNHYQILGVVYAVSMCRVSLMLSLWRMPFLLECNFAECRGAKKHLYKDLIQIGKMLDFEGNELWRNTFALGKIFEI